MSNVGAPKGNTNNIKTKIWSDAIRLELAGNKNASKLRKLAKALIVQAEGGNMQAMKEMGDRLEGKPAQALEVAGPDGGDIPVRHKVDYVDADE